MKKLFAILMVICMLTSVFAVTAVPASAAGYTVSVCGLDKDGIVWAISIHDGFEEAWNEAIYYATHLEEAWNSAERYEEGSSKKMEDGGFERIIVDIYDDWNADSNGKFGSGVGFKNGVIYVPSNAKITVNLGGYTINGGEKKGKVMQIDAGADFNIYNGTIVGDIHAESKAKLSINNVYVAGNTIQIVRAAIGSASIFGEGSLTMIISLLALIASVAAIVVNVSDKKKAVSKSANNAANSEDEE